MLTPEKAFFDTWYKKNPNQGIIDYLVSTFCNYSQR